MEIKVEILCKSCRSKNLVRNGKSKSGEQRYICKECKKTMQLNMKRTGDDPEIKEKIILMAHNGNGVRQTSRILKIDQKTVMSTLKKNKVFKNKR